MGEAKRRNAVGNTAPNPKYRRTKKITRKQEQDITADRVSALMRYPRLPWLYKEGVRGNE